MTGSPGSSDYKALGCDCSVFLLGGTNPDRSHKKVRMIFFLKFYISIALELKYSLFCVTETDNTLPMKEIFTLYHPDNINLGIVS